MLIIRQIQYNTVQYSNAMYCNTIQYSTVQFSTVQYSAVQYSNRKIVTKNYKNCKREIESIKKKKKKLSPRAGFAPVKPKAN